MGGWCHILRSSAWISWLVYSSVSTRCESVCARSLGGEPGRWAGEQPVLSSTLGTRRFSRAISSASVFRLFLRELPSSSASSLAVFEGRGLVSGCFQSATSFVSRISARMPHTTAVSPFRTTALPEAWVREPVWRDGGRVSEGLRPEGRRDGEDLRWA